VIATWSIALSNSLSPRQRSLLEKNLGRSVSSSSSTHRSQAANRQAALGRLALRIDGALYVTPPRRVTKPTKGSQKRRVDEKKRRSVTKVTRRRPVGED
jgi:ribosome-associated protein